MTVSLNTVLTDVGIAGEITDDVVGAVAGLFPGAATVFNIIKLIGQVAVAAPAIYKDVTADTPVITKLANAALAIMQAKTYTPQQLADHTAYLNAAQTALSMGLPMDSPEALAALPDLAKRTTLF